MRFAQTLVVPVALISCVLAGCGAPVAAPEALVPARTVDAPALLDEVPPPTAGPSDDEIRAMVWNTRQTCSRDTFVFERRDRLAQLGERAFPVYEAILTDPKTDAWMIDLTCAAIPRAFGDRRRFIPLAINRLTAERAQGVWAENQTDEPNLVHRVYGVARQSARERCAVLSLLGAIGDERQAPTVARFLSSEAGEVRETAAGALAKIGTQRELDALSALLKPGAPQRDADELQHLTECRDKLAKRLKEHPVPKTLTN